MVQREEPLFWRGHSAIKAAKACGDNEVKEFMILSNNLLSLTVVHDEQVLKETGIVFQFQPHW